MSTTRRASPAARATLLLCTLLPAVASWPRAQVPSTESRLAFELLQDHIPNGGPMTVMRFRNIWFRPIPPGK